MKRRIIYKGEVYRDLDGLGLGTYGQRKAVQSGEAVLVDPVFAVRVGDRTVLCRVDAYNRNFVAMDGTGDVFPIGSAESVRDVTRDYHTRLWSDMEQFKNHIK